MTWDSHFTRNYGCKKEHIFVDIDCRLWSLIWVLHFCLHISHNKIHSSHSFICTLLTSKHTNNWQNCQFYGTRAQNKDCRSHCPSLERTTDWFVQIRNGKRLLATQSNTRGFNISGCSVKISSIPICMIYDRSHALDLLLCMILPYNKN